MLVLESECDTLTSSIWRMGLRHEHNKCGPLRNERWQLIFWSIKTCWPYNAIFFAMSNGGRKIFELMEKRVQANDVIHFVRMQNIDA